MRFIAAQCARSQAEGTRIIATWIDKLRYGLTTPWVRTVVVLWLAQVVSEIGFGFALPFTPLYVQELGVTDIGQAGLWAGFAAASFAVANGVMAPIWGSLADRFGYRIMIQRAYIGAGLALGGIAFAQTPEQMIVLRVFHGGLTGVYSGIATMVSLTTPQHHLGTVLGLMQSAVLLGIGLGPLLGGLFSDHFGLRATWAATGLILLATGVVMAFVVREPPRTTEQAEAISAEEAETQRRTFQRRLWLVVGLMALVRIANVAPNPVLALFVQELVPSPEHLGATVGLMLALTGIASTVSAVAVGRAADKLGRRTALLGCCVLTALLCPLHALVGSVWQLIALRTLVGLTQGGMGTALQALMVDVTPKSAGARRSGSSPRRARSGMGPGRVGGSWIAAAFGIQAVFLAMTPLYVTAAGVLAAVSRRTPGRTRPRPRDRGQASAAALSASRVLSRSMVAVVGLPGPKTARTPISFRAGTSSSGMMPPAQTTTSSTPRAGSSSKMRGKSVRWAPLRIERPIASTSSWRAVWAIISGVWRMPV